MTADIDIRMTTADDWRERRRLRLEMLEDTPLAFLDRLDDARGYPDAVWRSQAIRAAGAGNCTRVAVTPDGTWVGTMSAVLLRPTVATLVTVYVTPRLRGRDSGVADRLLAAVEHWVREQPGVERLELDVHEQNAGAIAFYRRHGFEPTGTTTPYPLDTAQLEIGFAKSLSRLAPGPSSGSGTR